MNEPIKGRNRRLTQDVWFKMVRILAVSGWVLFTIALLMSYFAAPEDDFGIYRYRGIEIRKFWLTPLTGYMYIVLWISAFCSYLCLIVENFRSRRKTDSKKFNIILLMLISMAWISYILINLKS